MTDSGTGPYDDVETKWFYDVLEQLAGKTPDPTPLPALGQIDGEWRAIAGAQLAGIGERLQHDHQHDTNADLGAIRDQSGRWLAPDERLRVRLQRVADTRTGLQWIRDDAPDGTPLEALAEVTQQLLTAAEQGLLAMLAELHGAQEGRATSVTETIRSTQSAVDLLRERGLL